VFPELGFAVFSNLLLIYWPSCLSEFPWAKAFRRFPYESNEPREIPGESCLAYAFVLLGYDVMPLRFLDPELDDSVCFFLWFLLIPPPLLLLDFLVLLAFAVFDNAIRLSADATVMKWLLNLSPMFLNKSSFSSLILNYKLLYTY